MKLRKCCDPRNQAARAVAAPQLHVAGVRAKYRCAAILTLTNGAGGSGVPAERWSKRNYFGHAVSSWPYPRVPKPETRGYLHSINPPRREHGVQLP
jgi:hypothetical protein